MPKQRAVVFGGGSAGIGVAVTLARAGLRTTVVEPDEDAADRAAFVLRQMTGDSGGGEAYPRITPRIDALGTADFVLEASAEDPEARAVFYRDWIRRVPAKALLATTDLDGLPAQMVPADMSGRILAFRFYSPLQLRSLVEITPGPSTPARLVDAAMRLARDIGRTPVPARAGRASIGQRLGRRLYEAAEILLIDGAVPHEVDEAMVAFGFDIGPFEAQDLVGLDVAYADRKRLAATRDTNRRYVPVSDRMVEEGRLGKKIGVGWYRYPGGGGAVIDPLVEDLVREEAWFAGIEPRSFSAEETQTRLLLAMVHEGAAMLLDATAATAGDIDTVSVCGFGFPAAPGGVMRWADSKGAAWVCDAISELAADDPVIWSPSPVIEDCAQKGVTFADWSAEQARR